MRSVFLNVDAGESDDEPPELYALAHVLNIACGGHAGDAASMVRVIDACNLHGTIVGAHPSYPDREGFGRMRMDMTTEDLFLAVKEQCLALLGFAQTRGARVFFAKPHGALYHAANVDEAIAHATVSAIVEVFGQNITLIGPPNGRLADAARALGIRHARERFADRGVRADGSLIARGEPGALIHDAAVAADRARFLRADVDTICVHGDTPNAVAIARAVREVVDASPR